VSVRHFKGHRLLDPWKMRRIGCPETSVTKYQPTPCNIPEERIVQSSVEMKYEFLNEISCGTARNFQNKMALYDCICSGTLLFDLGRDVAVLVGVCGVVAPAVRFQGASKRKI
jgi:hypothetical protein